MIRKKDRDKILSTDRLDVVIIRAGWFDVDVFLEIEDADRYDADLR
jgi:hypothetical protein